MKDLSRIKKNEKGCYVEYIRKNGRWKGQIYKIYGQIREHCLTCNDPFFAKNSAIEKGNGRFCSNGCSRTREFNSSWRGGKTYSCGYVFVLNRQHPCCNNDGYIQEHRLIMERYLERYLRPEEIVHHKNGIRDDNRIENLELFENHGKHMSGRGNSNWRGGISKDHYPTKFRKLREAVRKRDNYACQLCNIRQNGKTHHVHHVDYDKKNLDLLNLVTLCASCNHKVNFNRDYWKEYFKELNNRRR